MGLKNYYKHSDPSYFVIAVHGKIQIKGIINVYLLSVVVIHGVDDNYYNCVIPSVNYCTILAYCV